MPNIAVSWFSSRRMPEKFSLSSFTHVVEIDFIEQKPTQSSSYLPKQNSLDDPPKNDPDLQVFRNRSKSEGAVLKSCLKKAKNLKKPHVSFADLNGSELEDIRFFKSEKNDLYTRIQTCHLDHPDPDPDPGPDPDPLDLNLDQAYRRFVPAFSLPWTKNGTRSILSELDARKICMEAFLILPDRIIGTLLVKNLSNRKSVFVRYTLNDWKSSTDSKSIFLTSVSPDTDKFRFEILKLDQCYETGAELKLAFCYEIVGWNCQFWDNNGGKDYNFMYRKVK